MFYDYFMYFIFLYVIIVIFILFTIIFYCKKENNITINSDIVLLNNISIIGDIPDECVICMEKKCNVVLSCRHNVICKKCFLQMIKNKLNKCPICRKYFSYYYLII